MYLSTLNHCFEQCSQSVTNSEYTWITFYIHPNVKGLDKIQTFPWEFYKYSSVQTHIWGDMSWTSRQSTRPPVFPHLRCVCLWFSCHRLSVCASHLLLCCHPSCCHADCLGATDTSMSCRPGWLWCWCILTETALSPFVHLKPEHVTSTAPGKQDTVSDTHRHTLGQ